MRNRYLDSSFVQQSSWEVLRWSFTSCRINFFTSKWWSTGWLMSLVALMVTDGMHVSRVCIKPSNIFTGNFTYVTDCIWQIYFILETLIQDEIIGVLVICAFIECLLFIPDWARLFGLINWFFCHLDTQIGLKKRCLQWGSS